MAEDTELREEREKRDQSHFRMTGCFRPILVSLRQSSSQVKPCDSFMRKMINMREGERRNDMKHRHAKDKPGNMPLVP